MSYPLCVECGEVLVDEDSDQCPGCDKPLHQGACFESHVCASKDWDDLDEEPE